jgi:hypothetical protein
MKATLLAPLVFCQTSFPAIFHHEAHEAHEGFGHYYIPISSFVLFATFVVKGLFPILVAATPLRNTMLESLRGWRKLSGIWNIRLQGIDSRQGAKHAKFGGKR